MVYREQTLIKLWCADSGTVSFGMTALLTLQRLALTGYPNKSEWLAHIKSIFHLSAQFFSKDMETITRKEAFECALAQLISIAQVVNNGKQNLYDYALILKAKSVQPIIPLQPLEYFQWNENQSYGEKSYAFAPITEPYNSLIIGMCGRPYFGEVGTFEIINAHEHPAKWIREVLTKQYIRLSYDCIGVLSRYELAYDTSIFSKVHSKWIKYTNRADDEIIYFPYYNQSQRKCIIESFPRQAINEITDDYWSE